MKQKSIIEQVKAARRASTPAIAITTSDQPACEEKLAAGLNGDAPKIRWDVVRGLTPVNDAGAEVLKSFAEEELFAAANPDGALNLALRFPPASLFFFWNAHRFVGDAAVAQAILTARDQFKADNRTLLMLSPIGFSLPSELTDDVSVFDEELPGDDEIKKILSDVYDGAELGELPGDDDFVSRAVDSVRGLSAFACEQVFAMSLTPDGLDVASSWSRKEAAINQTDGLSITRDGFDFEELGGTLERAIDFARKIASGPMRPRVIVFVDEIEKSLGGAGTTGAGDTSGTTQDQVGALLRDMENNKWDGLIAVGSPGTGKTLFANSIGKTFGIPTISLDLGKMKKSLVGESEKAIRTALAKIKAIAGDRAFFVATCNKLEALPPELRRRFRSGIWFFDLPSKAERAHIWKYYLAKYELADVELDGDFTGAEIRNICDLAWRLSIPIAEAAGFVVPVVVSDPAGVRKLRELADGRFLSANYPGVFSLKKTTEPDAGAKKRSIRISN